MSARLAGLSLLLRRPQIRVVLTLASAGLVLVGITGILPPLQASTGVPLPLPS